MIIEWAIIWAILDWMVWDDNLIDWAIIWAIWWAIIDSLSEEYDFDETDFYD